MPTGGDEKKESDSKHLDFRCWNDWGNADWARLEEELVSGGERSKLDFDEKISKTFSTKNDSLQFVQERRKRNRIAFLSYACNRNPAWKVFADANSPLEVLFEGVGKDQWLDALAEQPMLIKYCVKNTQRELDWKKILEKCPDFEKKAKGSAISPGAWMGIIQADKSKADACPCLDQFSASDWASLLSVRPDLYDKCKCAGEIGKYWLVKLLTAQPQLAEKLPQWKELDRDQLIDLFIERPEFASGFSGWINSYWWSKIISKQPQFANKCYCWRSFDADEWVRILSAQPQFSSKCNKWQDFDDEGWDTGAWIDLLIAQPQFAEHCNWDRLAGCSRDSWAKLLVEHPEYADRCDWDRMNSTDEDEWGEGLFDNNARCWVTLLSARPSFADRCTCWEAFDGYELAGLIEKHPEIGAAIDWSMMNLYSLAYLLSDLPQYADRCDWDKLEEEASEDDDMVATLLNIRPQLAEKYLSEDSENRPTSCDCDWKIIMKANPDLLDKVELDPWDWCYLLKECPQYADRCDWAKLREIGGDDWRDLLEAHPEFAAHLDMHGFKARDVVFIAQKHPELVRESWKGLSCDWRESSWNDAPFWVELIKYLPEHADDFDWDELKDARPSGLLWLLVDQPQFVERLEKVLKNK